MRFRIPLVSGHREDARQLSQMLESLPLQLNVAESLEQARAAVREAQFDAVLTEASLPDGTWMDTLHLIRESPGDVEVVVTDPRADARLWAEALNMGAYDLLAQPYYEPEVRRIVCNACSHRAGIGLPAPA